MEPSIVLESADVAISPSTQDSTTSCANQSPNTHDTVDTETASFNELATNQVPDHDQMGTPGQEAFVSRTAASNDPPEELSADEEDGPPILWCRVELRGPGEWVKCVAFQKDGNQGLHPNGAPRDDTRGSYTGGNYTGDNYTGDNYAGANYTGENYAGENNPRTEDGAIQVLPPDAPSIQYSNRFVDRTDAVVAAEPWPEALDLDQERGKRAGSKLQRDEPIIEFVTTIGTNIQSSSYPYPNMTYRSTNSILSDPKIATDVIRREVVIHSVHIINAFRAMVTYYPGLELLGITMTIPEPYCAFYHYHEEIKALRRTHDVSTKPLIGDKPSETTPVGPESYSTEMTEHLQILCDFIEAKSLQDVELEQKRHGQNPPVATYRMMWLLFKPGTKVYHFSGGRATAGIVLSIQTDSGSKRPGIRSLKLWHLDFDGFKMGRRDLSYNFKPFDGEKRVSELPVCPCDIYDAQDNNRLREELILRGRRFWKFLPGVQVDYNGRLPDEAIEWSGRVIIDPTTYIKYTQVDENSSQRWEDRLREVLMPPVVGKVQDAMNTEVKLNYDRNVYDAYGYPKIESAGEKLNRHRREAQELAVYEGPWAEYENIIPGDTSSLELEVDVATEDRDARYLFCPKDVIGFDLKTRRWMLLDVGCCKEVEFNDNAVNNLVMKDDRKTMIRSLVHRYTITDTTTANVLQGGRSQSSSSQPWTADFIKNKGDGQIFLLHGGPGVGKTYTAECIAEATRRPLLSLTCGDFGTDATVVEQKLSKWFRLAEVWCAVMLLDEADVFLERRQLTDLNRNSLVSGTDNSSIRTSCPFHDSSLLQIVSLGGHGQYKHGRRADIVAVFLRTMEYYRGILFLTTNRVGNFDDAFVSRIHSVIHYEGFSHSERERIWGQFFTKLETERRTQIKVDPDARKYVLNNEDMRGVKWNGREIRNAFQTAVAFAEYRFSQLSPEQKNEVGGRACLEAEDFARVSEMTRAFKKYLESIGQDEARVAKTGRFR